MIPDSASDPPHSCPRIIALHGALTRDCKLASLTNELAIASPISAILAIEPYSATFNTSARESPIFLATSIIANSFGVPIVRKIVAKLFGFAAKPEIVLVMRAKSPSISPDQSWLTPTAPIDASAIFLAVAESAECSGRIKTWLRNPQRPSALANAFN